MERLIDKMLSTEFERYATADLNRPLVEDQQVLEGVSNVLKLLNISVNMYGITGLVEKSKKTL
jgi:vacuolar protein sorting-associated protein 54